MFDGDEEPVPLAHKSPRTSTRHGLRGVRIGEAPHAGPKSRPSHNAMHIGGSTRADSDGLALVGR